MATTKGRTRSFVLVLALELIVGAVIWFSNRPAEAQPAAAETGSASIGSTAPATAPVPSAGTAGEAGSAAATPAQVPVESATNTACPTPKPSSAKKNKKPLWEEVLPIVILIVVIAIVLLRLPKVELGHSKAFRRRRLLNWLPLGLTYSFLYFARYNIKSFQGVGISASEFGDIFAYGAGVYGLAFLLNGPLTDRWGGRRTIMIAAAGAGIANLWMGYMAATGNTLGMSPVTAFTVAYALNMYFQSFGAVSIVKVNAAWFHVRERGTFGGIFGILISLGIYFAFDIIGKIKAHFDIQWIFLIPAMVLFIFFVLSFVFVRNNPSEAGHDDFDLGDETASFDDAETKPGLIQWLRQIGRVLAKMLSHPVLLTIAFIELCSGFLRQAIMQWGQDFGKGVGIGDHFVFQNWGMVICVAGITGGMFAGAISDHVFQSRRSPVSGVLYGIMLVGSILILALFSAPGAIGWIVAFMSMAIIGVHGMLTATASADFAGKKYTGVAVGLIDGFVYLGTSIQSKFYGATLPAAKVRDAAGCLVPNPDRANVDNWHIWPYAMIPVAVIGFLLTLRIWNAKPRSGASSGH